MINATQIAGIIPQKLLQNNTLQPVGTRNFGTSQTVSDNSLQSTISGRV